MKRRSQHVLEEQLIRECVRSLLIEIGVLDKFKGWIEEVPGEARKIWSRLKQEAMESKDLAVILMKMASGKEVSDEEKMAVQDQLADIGKAGVFGASLVAPGLWPLVADIFMIGAEETGVSFRPSSFEEWEPFIDEPVDVEAAKPDGVAAGEKEGKDLKESIRITRNKLRGIIREHLLLEQQEMLSILADPGQHSKGSLEYIQNKIANYALNNDITGALKDPDIGGSSDLDLDIDEMRPWIKRVGDPAWLGKDHVAPPNWDPKAVSSFLSRLENAWYDRQKQATDLGHRSGQATKEREIIGNALTMDYVMPDDIKGLKFQIRRTGGAPSNINIEDDGMVSNIRAEDATRAGLTLDDIIKVLRDGGAKERKKQRPIKHTPPTYD